MNEKISALEHRLSESLGTTERVDLLAELSKEVCWSDAKRALALADEAEALSRSEGYELGVYASQLCRGRALINLSFTDEALNCLIPCAEYFRRTQDRRELLALQNMGVVHLRRGEYARALECWSTCLQLAKAGNDRKALADALLNIAAVYRGLGYFGPALGYALESLEIVEELGDIRVQMLAYCLLGIIYGELGNFELSLDCLHRGLELNGASLYTDAQAMLLSNLSGVYVAKGDHENAMKWLRRSLTFQIGVGHRFAESITLASIGCEYEKQGKVALARAYFLKVLSVAGEIGDRFQEAQAHLQLGALCLREDSIEQALEHLQEGLRLAVMMESRATQSNGHRLLSLVCERTGRFEESLKHYKIHFELEREIFGFQVQAELSRLQNRFEVDRRLRGRNCIWPGDDEAARALGEMRALNQALLLLDKWLMRQNQARNELVASSAHDLRGPITALQINVSFLKQLNPDWESGVLTWLENIELSSRKLAGLVDVLLDLSALETGCLRFLAQPFDLGAIAKEVIQENSAVARAKQVSLEWGLESQPVYVQADQATATRVVGELVSNAIRFSSAGARVLLRIGAGEGGAWCEVVAEGVRQNAEGPGLVFQGDTQVGEEPSGGELSSGLGLAIVKRLVEAMDGSVNAISDPGAGATFVMRLPLASWGERDLLQVEGVRARGGARWSGRGGSEAKGGA